MDIPTILVNKSNIATRLKKEGTNEIRQGPSKTYVSGKKIDDNEELPVMSTIGLDLAKQIQQARLNKSLSQKDVAKSLNMQLNAYQLYENGTAVNNGAILNKIGTTLGVKLTGK